MKYLNVEWIGNNDLGENLPTKKKGIVSFFKNLFSKKKVDIIEVIDPIVELEKNRSRISSIYSSRINELENINNVYNDIDLKELVIGIKYIKDLFDTNDKVHHDKLSQIDKYYISPFIDLLKKNGINSIEQINSLKLRREKFAQILKDRNNELKLYDKKGFSDSLIEYNINFGKLIDYITFCINSDTKGYNDRYIDEIKYGFLSLDIDSFPSMRERFKKFDIKNIAFSEMDSIIGMNYSQNMNIKKFNISKEVYEMAKLNQLKYVTSFNVGVVEYELLKVNETHIIYNLNTKTIMKFEQDIELLLKILKDDKYSLKAKLIKDIDQLALKIKEINDDIEMGKVLSSKIKNIIKNFIKKLNLINLYDETDLDIEFNIMNTLLKEDIV